MVDKALNRREARWWERLSGLDLSIQYRPGKLNPADAPSRRPHYEEEDSTLAFKSSALTTVQEQQLIKRGYSSEVALLDFAMSQPQSYQQNLNDLRALFY